VPASCRAFSKGISNASKASASEEDFFRTSRSRQYREHLITAAWTTRELIREIESRLAVKDECPFSRQKGLPDPTQRCGPIAHAKAQREIPEIERALRAQFRVFPFLRTDRNRDQSEGSGKYSLPHLAGFMNQDPGN